MKLPLVLTIMLLLLMTVLVVIMLVHPSKINQQSKLTVGQPGKPPTSEFQYPTDVYALDSGGYALVYGSGDNKTVIYFNEHRLKSCEVGSTDKADEVCELAQ